MIAITNKRPITDRQAMVLSFIHRHLADYGRPPTYREIRDHLQVKGTNGINDHLVALERRGMVERDDGRARSIRLTPKARAFLGYLNDEQDQTYRIADLERENARLRATLDRIRSALNEGGDT